MQISMQDIRTMGYKKLFKLDDEFIKRLHIQNSMLSGVGVAPYSVLSKINDANVSSRYNAFLKLANYVEPMREMKIEEYSKRRFRNIWTSMWKSFAKAMNFSEQDICMFEELGIKIAFTEIDDLAIYEFFSIVICWGRLTSDELHFKSLDLSILDVLDTMVQSDSVAFGHQVMEWGMQV